MSTHCDRIPDARASPTVRVADGIVDTLADAGVRHVFGVSGGNIEELFDALHRSRRDIRGIVAKHEFAAATMADGGARVTGTLGVVATTSGGGAMNLIPGLAESHASRVPVLALVGEPPTPLSGTGVFQDTSGLAGTFDARQVFGAVSRFCARATDPAAVPALLDRAVDAALGLHRGPSVLLLPKDVQQSMTDWAAPHSVQQRSALAHDDRTEPDGRNEATVQAARILTRDAPGAVVVIAGPGVGAARARSEFARLAELLDAAVAVTPDARDAFDNHDPRFVGVVGMMGHPSAVDAVCHAATVVLVGTRLPVMARFGLGDLAGAALVCIDPEPPFVADAVHLRGDLRAALAELCRLLPERDRSRTGAARPVEPLPLPPHHGPGLRYREAMSAIDDALPDGATVVVDAGNTGAAAIHQLRAPRSGRCLVALGMGGMGYSFGAGIGAALATGRRSYVIAGDGAFFMHGMEIHTAAQYLLPVTFIVFDNRAHAMCAVREGLYGEVEHGDNRFLPSRLAAGVAAMFPTVAARHVDTADALRAALVADASAKGPTFIAVACDADEIPPFAPFLPNREEPRHDRS